MNEVNKSIQDLDKKVNNLSEKFRKEIVILEKTGNLGNEKPN
jgi:hypothetical protein